MTYIDLINNFWLLDEDWEFTCCETRLYFYLMKTANRLGWVDSWTRSDTKVSSDVGVSVNSMKSARNRLVQAGLITFKSGGKGQRDKTRYQISYQNLTPKLQPKGIPKVIPKLQPNLAPSSLLYNVRALDKDKDKDLNKESPNGDKKVVSQKKESDLSFVDEAFKDIFREWLEYKRERKENYKSEKSLKMCYNHLLKLSDDNPEKAKLVIEQSIASNYAGLFELKNYGTRTITKNIYEQKRIDSERRKSQLMAEFAEADAKFLAEQEAKRKAVGNTGEISDTFTDGS